MHPVPFRYFMLNKIQGMDSQFKSDHPTLLLGEVAFDFPEGTHAVGRLDKNSEGLLILTTNKKITSLLFQGKSPHNRVYLVQVKYNMNEENLHRLRTGVSIRIRGGDYYTTPPCDVRFAEKPHNLFAPPVQYPEYHPTTWLTITLMEGKYHQVRKMVSAVGHRCLRLIRVSIENMLLNELQPGHVQEFTEEAFFELLKLDRPSMDQETALLSNNKAIL